MKGFCRFVLDIYYLCNKIIDRKLKNITKSENVFRFHLLQDFQSLSDHFGMLCMRGVKTLLINFHKSPEVDSESS